MKIRFDDELIRKMVEESATASGVPLVVTDAGALAQLADLLLDEDDSRAAA